MEDKTALSGLKVVDMGVAGVGPLATKYLGDHGATVVWIESAKHPDLTRLSSPFKDNIVGLNRSASPAPFSSSKYSLGLNIAKPGGKEVAWRLLEWADVFIQNFTPGVVDRLGLGYEKLKDLNPGLIMVSTSLQGLTGPRSRLRGFGFALNGLAGIVPLTGWPDRKACGLSVPYVDYLVPWLIVAGVAAALQQRRDTGLGQHIDLSQYEAALQYVSVPLLDYAVNSRIQSRNGNRSDHASPHGVFRCQGDDRWCAIAVLNDKQWQAFGGIAGHAEWVDDPRFINLEMRKRNEAELEILVETWTAQHTPEEVMHRLQSAGVPAGVVNSCQDLLDKDPQIKHRHFFWDLDHPVIGKLPHSSWPAKLAKTPCRLTRFPCFVEHTEYVCKTLLDMGNEEFDTLVTSGVLEIGTCS